ncbi:MAG: T9SS type A sorting domain-containing protein [Chryseobacterium sp.]|uniref:T9SS type A sorting domain-containing protein n=1 Tax=Chryseobacterium sp. TaxID=1871047 RepID=UPI00282CEC19|nr:T9SS type A sorting domain-containing protein [Chryseobacterium sp.]MDR2236583.1 T9SS type A sorting domain-containing protein [Chryseobacterium sp.]
MIITELKIPFPVSLENGTYYWAVVGENSVGTQMMCDGIQTFTVSDALAVTEVKSNPDMVKVYPNPAANVLHISMKNITENVEFCILDTTGRIIRSQKTDSTTRADQKISLDGLTSGTYILNIKGNTINYTTKFIKK